MSYDIRLKDPVTDETLDLPVKHVMTGGTYQADYDEQTTRTFSAKPISEAWLNVTYNYGRYYYDATDGDSRFAHDEISAYYADGTTGPVKTEYGIRGIYGKTGVESIPMLEDMIERIKAKYKPDGEWLITSRERTRYRDSIMHFIIGMNAAVRIIRKISAKVLVMITGKQQPRMPFGRCISL